MAEAHLVRAGARILARNYRSAPGEIDLVIEHDDALVAVEVKTRSAVDLEAPEEAVTRWKLQRMIRGLETFAMDNEMLEWHRRLDVVAIEIDFDGAVQRCEHLRDVYLG